MYYKCQLNYNHCANSHLVNKLVSRYLLIIQGRLGTHISEVIKQELWKQGKDLKSTK